MSHMDTAQPGQKEALPFVTTWMDPEGATLSEINQTERQMLY